MTRGTRIIIGKEAEVILTKDSTTMNRQEKKEASRNPEHAQLIHYYPIIVYIINRCAP